MWLQVLLYLLLVGGGMALLHVVLGAAYRSHPLAVFCLTSAAWSCLAGLFVLRAPLSARFAASPAVGLAWAVGFALGFLVVGVVLAVLWSLVVGGLSRLVGGSKGGQ